METDNIIIDKTKALVGILEKGINLEKLNFCLLLARWYIYVEKLNLQEPFYYRFLCLFKHKLKLERMICQRNDALDAKQSIRSSMCDLCPVNLWNARTPYNMCHPLKLLSVPHHFSHTCSLFQECAESID